MPSPPKRVGVLTGGGDCPGINAVLRAVTKDCLHHGIEVIGIEDGFLGLIEDRLRPLAYTDVSDILTRGGTILGSSNRAEPARYATGSTPNGKLVFEDVTPRCLEHAERAGLEALVVIGGDGTLACARPFVRAGLNCIGVPKTIDNDIHGTDVSFGFATAVQTATDALDRVHTTADSHHRALVVEVMGRNAGWIALHAGLAGGADVILLPELPFALEAVCDKVTRRLGRGRNSTLICVAEGARTPAGGQHVAQHDATAPDPVRLGGVAAWLARELQARTPAEARHVVLGHVQRGGTPVAADRVLATQLGFGAATLLKRGARDRMVAIQDGELTDVPFEHSAGRQRLVPPDHPLLAAARAVYTSFCEPLG
jgi:6-phosphofructokinase 1